MSTTQLNLANRTFRLPDLRDDQTPGSRFVRRAATLLFAVLGLLMVAAVLVSALVTVDMTIDGDGFLHAQRVWPVRSQEVGIVNAVFVIAGESVQAGQPLVRLDTFELASTLDQLRKAMAVSRVEYERSRVARLVEERRIEERIHQTQTARIRPHSELRQRLAEHGFPDSPDSIIRHYRIGTHALLDVAIASILAVESEIRNSVIDRQMLIVSELELEKQRLAMVALASQITSMEERIARLMVRAPAAGVVLTEHLERLAGSLVREGDVLLEIAEVGGWRATLAVAERDIRNIYVGDPVKIDVLAFPRDREWLPGVVISVGEQPVAPDGIAEARLNTYRLLVMVDTSSLDANLEAGLRHGYTVRGRITHRSGRIATLLWHRLMQR